MGIELTPIIASRTSFGKGKAIETVFSEIKSWLGHKVHAVTFKGFELKVTLAVVAFAFKVALKG